MKGSCATPVGSSSSGAGAIPDHHHGGTDAFGMPRAVEPGGNCRADLLGEPVLPGWRAEPDRRATSLGVCIWLGDF